MSASPDSFSRMRWKAGAGPFTRSGPHREAREAADDHILPRRARELRAQLLHPLAELALGDPRSDVLGLVGGLLLEHAQLGVARLLRDVLLGHVADGRRG